jgi:hypothetical protein
MTVQERLDRLYRAMQGQHLLYPTYLPMLHDPWQVDLQQPTPAWWNRYRFYHFGPLRITVDLTDDTVGRGPSARIPGARILEIAEWVRQQHALPHLHIRGSQSPLSPKYPYEGSDVNLACFIPADQLFGALEQWCLTQQQIKTEVMLECSKIFGVEVDCDFFLEEFRSYPFLMDAADLESPQAIEQWDVGLEQVVTILEQRWNDFLARQDQVQHDCERIMALMQQFLDTSSVVQIVAEAPTQDVLWWIQTAYWTKVFHLDI